MIRILTLAHMLGKKPENKWPIFDSSSIRKKIEGIRRSAYFGDERCITYTHASIIGLSLGELAYSSYKG
ncbi:hypothetical protein KFK09_004911 [Dendrobium nobile]|uniref:Uncharacterized protein n=1 Tax=Dendrobium nobile TaxID=94219 RepID=A0A8T3BWS0_DENNO|nr:hypothetical protein KFK09_004911 [Dendrobium nobile]